MKYLIVLGDGMADRPIKELDGKTPLEVAKKPNIDSIARLGMVGLVKTIPDGCVAGSDVANLSVLGYDPKKYYSGRSPLEALSLGIEMKKGDVAIRTNLVTLSSHEPFEKKRMVDYSAGEIDSLESRELIEEIQNKLGSSKFTFYPGVSYRHCLIVKNGDLKTTFSPPHDISGLEIGDYLPNGEGSEEFTKLIIASGDILKKHPINKKIVEAGKRIATHIWFWGAGTKPELTPFKEKYNITGAIVSAVDLLKGIAKGTGMNAPKVVGATGTLQTNWDGKAQSAIDEFASGTDFVYIHLEAPDECSHQGDTKGKIKAIEKVDYVLGKIIKYLKSSKEEYRIALLPDHATPINIMTHSKEPVPYVIYKSDKELVGDIKYSEKEAQRGVYLDDASLIMKNLLKQ